MGDNVIWTGAAITLFGVGWLFYCVVLAMRVRRSNLTDEEMQARLRKVVLINISALGASTLGLALVITGIVLKR